MKKKIAIDIDVLRDWLSALINVYEKQIGDFSEDIKSLDNIWEYFKFPIYIETERETDDPDITEKVMVEDLKSEWQSNREYFNKFVVDNILEIFGHARERTPNGVAYLNKLQNDNPDCEITLFSVSKNKLIPPTYFFLSKTGCEIKNVKFIDNILDLNSDDYYKIITYNNSWDDNFENIKIINSIKEIINFT